MSTKLLGVAGVFPCRSWASCHVEVVKDGATEVEDGVDPLTVMWDLTQQHWVRVTNTCGFQTLNFDPCRGP